MIQTLEDVLVEENFVHCTHHLRGVVNEVIEVLNNNELWHCAERLDEAMNDFGSALAAWAERLPDEAIEEVEEIY